MLDLGEIQGCDWNAGNREKCQKHGVTTAEIEELFKGDILVRPDAAHSLSETRHHAIGRTFAGRYVLVVFTVRKRESGLYVRPISARYMHRGEVRKYEEA